MTDDKSRHDFKNQLAIIRGFAEILLDEAAVGDPRRRAPPGVPVVPR